MTAFFDAHLHIIDPQFPLMENQGFLPEAFTCEDYLARLSDYQILGGAIVSGSFQGFDQTYLTHALEKLGPSFVGVTQVPHTVSDEELNQLNQAGIRAVRFNLFRGNSETTEYLVSMARRVYDQFGWHVELYVDASNMGELSNTLIALPKCSIDHLGMRSAGFKEMLRLVENGVHVKATGFGRIDFEPAQVLKKIHEVNPEALMFGSDLPSTRAKTPFKNSDIDLVIETLGDKGAERALSVNALEFYGIESPS